MEQETLRWEHNAIPLLYTLPALLLVAIVVAVVIGVFFAVIPRPKN